MLNGATTQLMQELVNYSLEMEKEASSAKELRRKLKDIVGNPEINKDANALQEALRNVVKELQQNLSPPISTDPNANSDVLDGIKNELMNILRANEPAVNNFTRYMTDINFVEYHVDLNDITKPVDMFDQLVKPAVTKIDDTVFDGHDARATDDIRRQLKDWAAQQMASLINDRLGLTAAHQRISLLSLRSSAYLASVRNAEAVLNNSEDPFECGGAGICADLSLLKALSVLEAEAQDQLPQEIKALAWQVDKVPTANQGVEFRNAYARYLATIGNNDRAREVRAIGAPYEWLNDEDLQNIANWLKIKICIVQTSPNGKISYKRAPSDGNTIGSVNLFNINNTHFQALIHRNAPRVSSRHNTTHQATNDLFKLIMLSKISPSFSLKSVQMLLEQGADITVRDEYMCNNTILTWLIANTNIDKLDEILGVFHAHQPEITRALLDLKDNDGKTPLQLAICKGWEHTCDQGDTSKKMSTAIELLLQYGANINSQDKDGNTSLHVAFMRRDLNAILCLVNNGADLEMLNNNGCTPHDMLDGYNHEQTTLYLKSNAKVFTLASKTDFENICAKIRQYIDECHTTVNTVLYFLLENKFVSEMDLTNWKNKINLSNNTYYNPITLAAKLGNLEIIKHLVAHGADINNPNAVGNTALHIAVDIAESAQDLQNTTRWLLEYGANRTAVNKHGVNALGIARHNGKGKNIESALQALYDKIKLSQRPRHTF